MQLSYEFEMKIHINFNIEIIGKKCKYMYRNIIE